MFRSRPPVLYARVCSSDDWFTGQELPHFLSKQRSEGHRAGTFKSERVQRIRSRVFLLRSENPPVLGARAAPASLFRGSSNEAVKHFPRKTTNVHLGWVAVGNQEPERISNKLAVTHHASLQIRF